MFDGQLVQAHLVRPLYKHLLGWPIAFSDLEHVDHFTHESLIKMTELDDVEVCVCVCVCRLGYVTYVSVCLSPWDGTTEPRNGMTY